MARQEEGRLVLEKPEAIKQRLRARFTRRHSGKGLGSALITSVNWAEVLQKSLSAALLWPQTRNPGLSLADRACLSLALRLNLPLRIELLR